MTRSLLAGARPGARHDLYLRRSRRALLAGATDRGLSDSTIAYAYDRFGRVVRDGELTYTLDANSNRTTIGYPGGVTARYGHGDSDTFWGLSVDDRGRALRSIWYSDVYGGGRSPFAKASTGDAPCEKPRVVAQGRPVRCENDRPGGGG